MWEAFADAVCAQFGRAEFQRHLREFNRLKQTGSVAEFTERFNDLRHNLLAHHNSWDLVYFVIQFIDGLSREIRYAVILHRPQDLETSVSLACLQEDILDTLRREDKRVAPSYNSRPIPRTALPLPPPPPRTPPPPGPHPQDRHGTDAAHAASFEDKYMALRNYRRAKGLCFTCGERYRCDHHCGPTVQLHVVEELLQFLHPPVDESLPPE